MLKVKHNVKSKETTKTKKRWLYGEDKIEKETNKIF